jgi:hypothetical protein
MLQGTVTRAAAMRLRSWMGGFAITRRKVNPTYQASLDPTDRRRTRKKRLAPSMSASMAAPHPFKEGTDVAVELVSTRAAVHRAVFDGLRFPTCPLPEIRWIVRLSGSVDCAYGLRGS